ncbi:hypothetical protein [Singulisphaera sp. PoT]|uniref:hypothetical protein n=1 Tax=Singulisphaera sp. PoT TaxID=3411797 RepID=UPI003BF5E2AF
MRQATMLWPLWQGLLRPFVWVFTRPGHHRFVGWDTTFALNEERGALRLVGEMRQDFRGSYGVDGLIRSTRLPAADTLA